MPTGQGSVGAEAEWHPEEYYPPTCTCKISCDRLVDGKVVEEVKEKSWEDYEYPVGEWADGVGEGTSFV
jgi:hypothetical protein